MRTLFIKNVLFLWCLAWANLYVLVEVLPHYPVMMTISFVSGIAGVSVGACDRYSRYLIDSLSKLSATEGDTSLKHLGTIFMGTASAIILSAVCWLLVLATAPDEEAASLNTLFLRWWLIPSLSLAAPTCWIGALMTERLDVLLEREPTFED